MPASSDIQVVMFDTRPVNPWLARWLKRFKHVRLSSTTSPDAFNGLDFLTVKRNREIRWFLRQTKLPWLLMIDDDIVPLDDLADCPDTWPLIECAADVSSAHHISKRGIETHAKQGDLSMAVMKISRRALERIPPPWAHCDFNEDETAVARCECDYLAAKARAAGF